MKKLLFLIGCLLILISHNEAGKYTSKTKEILEEEEVPVEYDIVTATTYSASLEETDSTPLITASGFKISKKNAKRQRVIAVSRDLKRKLKFGQKVRIKGAGKYNGVYTVQDIMNKRYKKRIDILINPSDKGTKLKNVKLIAVK